MYTSFSVMVICFFPRNRLLFSTPICIAIALCVYKNNAIKLKYAKYYYEILYNFIRCLRLARVAKLFLQWIVCNQAQLLTFPAYIFLSLSVPLIDILQVLENTFVIVQIVYRVSFFLAISFPFAAAAEDF